MPGLRLSAKQIVLLVIVAAVLGGLGMAAWRALGDVVLPPLLALATVLVLALGLHLYRGLTILLPAHLRQQYTQLDALANLLAVLKPRRPLPPLGGVVVSADFANVVIHEVLDARPTTVVELGSGVSTVILGYTLQRLGHGRVYSFDHLQQYADITADNLRRHEVADVAQVACAPVKDLTLSGRTWKWYDPAALAHLPTIDLLIVDGPPDHLGSESRYPALPVLKDKLSPRAVIVLDDADRPDERAIVERWLAEFPNLNLQRVHLPTAKGTVILRRS